MILMSLFGGARSALLGGIILYYITNIIYRSNLKQITIKYLIYIVIMGMLLLTVFFYYGKARSGRFDILYTIENIEIELFYGGNFSELRDFAWLLSGWDGKYLYGKTFIAGIISFIPSFISDFRNEWNFGNFTKKITELGDEQFGLRAGILGEPYFNFGIFGVIMGGFLLGFIIRGLDNFIAVKVREETEYNAKIYILSGMFLTSMIYSVLSTPSFFVNYILFSHLGVMILIYNASKKQ
jgi:hypothetical protein